jgi:hypothetical protein
MNNSKQPMTLRGQTEAYLYDPRHCSAHVKSRWPFDRTTAVSPKHAEPFHLRMRLQQQRSARDTQPTCQSAGFDFYGRRTPYYIFLPPYHIALPFKLADAGARCGLV